MKVKQAMHEGVEWRSPDTPLFELARIMRNEEIGAIPIGENDRLVGMVTDRDIVCRALAEGRDPATLTARDVMTEGVFYCLEDEDVEDAIHLMETKRIRRLPVINRAKRMVGILSFSDVSHTVSRELAGELAEAVSVHH